MKTNVGNIDRWMRIILGIVIIALGIIYQSWWGVIGILPLLTGIIRRCPAYMPFGITTCRKDQAKG
jgi:sulfite exporter TauE/SafE